MNQADVLKTAEEAGFRKGGSVIFYDSRVMNYLPSAELTKFAELVAQHEAKVREELIARYDSLQSQYAELSVALDSAQHERAQIASKQQLNSGVNKNSSSIYEVDVGNDEPAQRDKYDGCD